MKRTKPSKHTITIKNPRVSIMACDPSLTAWGYVIISNDIIREFGCIKTKPEAKKRKIREGDDKVRRATIIIQTLIHLIETHDVQYIVSEQPHGSKSSRVAVMIGMIIGILQSLSIKMNIGIEWYLEKDAKQALFRKETATKIEVKQKIDELYDINWTGVGSTDEAIADATAIYHTAKQQSPVIKYLM